MHTCELSCWLPASPELALSTSYICSWGSDSSCRVGDHVAAPVHEGLTGRNGCCAAAADCKLRVPAAAAIAAASGEEVSAGACGEGIGGFSDWVTGRTGAGPRGEGNGKADCIEK